MKKFITLVSLLLLFSYQAKTQHIRCGADEYQAQLDKLFPEIAAQREAIENSLKNRVNYNRSQLVITIPVVFHVIYNNNAQNIPDARILEQLNVLNQDFSRNNLDASNTRPMFQSAYDTQAR